MTPLLCPLVALLLLLAAGASIQQQPAPRPPPPTQPCPRAIRVNTNYQFRNALHFICLQAPGPSSRPRLEVIDYYSRQVILSREVDEFGTNQLASFVDDDGNLRILIAVPDRVNGTSLYSIDQSGRFLDETHTINTQLVGAMSIWKLELNFEWQLAIANQPTYLGLEDRSSASLSGRNLVPDPKPIISLHSWRSTYFDSYQLIKMEQDGRINKLEPMHIGDIEFLIVAMESKQSHDESVGAGQFYRHQQEPTHSHIYKLDFGDGDLNWQHYQRLQTKLALDVKSFAIKHRNSLQMDYFIALLGQMDLGDTQQNQYAMHPNYNLTDAEAYGLIIYKFLGDKFVKILHTPQPTTTKLDTITYGTGDSYVILALLSQWTNQVNLYLFDGLTLNVIPSPIVNRAPQVPMPPRRYAGQPPHYGRYQRTLDSPSDLHLFMVPPATSTGNSTFAPTTDSSVKRTLEDLAPVSPVLAISWSDGSQDNNELTGPMSPVPSKSPTETLIQIPIDEMIRRHEEQAAAAPAQQVGPDSSHTKRNFDNSGFELLAWCKATINSILLDDFDSSAAKLIELPRVDQRRPIQLNGDLIIEDDLHVTNLLYAPRVLEQVQGRPPEMIEESPSDYTMIFNQIGAAHKEIDQVKRMVDNILVDDDTIQNVFTPLHFESIVVECANPMMNPRFQQAVYLNPQCAHVDEIRTIRMNNRDISNIQRQALLTGRSMVISKDVRFEHLILHGSVKILGRLNGIPVQDIVFGRGPSVGPITGHKNFRGGLFTNARLNVDFWNNYRVSRENYLTSSGDQRIDSSLRFTGIIVDPAARWTPQGPAVLSSRIERLNGLHLDAHLSQISVANEKNTFDAPIQFDELILNGEVQLLQNCHLSSINLEDIWLHTMFKYAPQNITYPIYFASDVHISYGGDLVVGGYINGVGLSPGSVYMRDGNYTISNPVLFEKDVSINRLHLEMALNGIQVLKSNPIGAPELAILYDGGDQILTGDKVINEIHLGGQTAIHGSINGNLNLSQLYDLANNHGKPHYFAHIRLSAPETRVAEGVPITILNTINGIPAHDLCSLALRVSQAPAAQYNRLRFEEPVVFTSLRCASINGFKNLDKYFLTRHGNQRVSGTLRLAGGAIFNTSLSINNQLNGFGVAPLARAVDMAIVESRTGYREIHGDLVVDELIANNINGLILSNIFLARSDYPQFVRAPMIFDHLDIENLLKIDKNLITNSFNGLNVTDLLVNTLQYDTPQVVYNHIQLNTLHLLPGTNLITKSINGQDLRRVFADAVLVDVPQQILAPKKFRGPVEFANKLYLVHSIDGLTEGELRFNLLLQGDELIDDDLEFNTDVIVRKELEIQSGIINDIDIGTFVDMMLYENRPGRKGLKILGNGSVRFKDVQVNNLVVAGTIQGIDLNRQALLKDDNRNGVYDEMIRAQRIMNNNQRILNQLDSSGRPFKVGTEYRGQFLHGQCHVHSCPRTTPVPFQIMRPATSPPPPPAPYNQMLVSPRPMLYPNQAYPGYQNQSAGYYQPPAPILQPPPAQYLPPPKSYVHHLIPNFVTGVLNTSQYPAAWRPNWKIIDQPPELVYSNLTGRPQQYNLPDPEYVEHAALMQAQAIRDLSERINRYLSVSFYYEIIQKHPHLGIPLHAAENPILNEESGALLLLKGTGRIGEPCLKRRQSVAVMTQARQRHPIAAFGQSSRIQDTSNPIAVESLIVGQNHYLFILDADVDRNGVAAGNLNSQVLIYLWSASSGMYETIDQIALDGIPTAMRAFQVNQIGCLVLANPTLLQQQPGDATNAPGNKTRGAPTLYCQRSPAQSPSFNDRVSISMDSVIFDLDVVSLAGGSRVLLAALGQQEAEQIGDLILGTYDIIARNFQRIAVRRTVRPLRVHFMRDTRLLKSPFAGVPVHLVISEGITSNERAEAITRIFRWQPQTNRLYESQVIRDNQFHDIKSVMLDEQRGPMLLLQSAHSISIYAPLNPEGRPVNSTELDCDSRYSLLQRLPTKGANKFLVFNDRQASNRTNPTGLQTHYLVLSRDDCEHSQYSTMILRAKFK